MRNDFFVRKVPIGVDACETLCRVSEPPPMSAQPSPGPSQSAQPAPPRPKYPPGIQAGAQEEKYRQKTRTLRKKIREIEAVRDYCTCYVTPLAKYDIFYFILFPRITTRYMRKHSKPNGIFNGSGLSERMWS